MKGVSSTSWAKENGENRTNKQQHSRHRPPPLNYFHVATRTQRNMCTKVDTVRIAK